MSSAVIHHVERIAPGVILVNFGIAAAAYMDVAPEHALAMAEGACLAFFGVEMAAKMRHQGRAFWRSKWNLFDLTVIVLAALPLILAGVDMSILRVARLARLARFFHMGRHLSGLRLLPRLVRWAALAHWRLKFGKTARLRIEL